MKHFLLFTLFAASSAMTFTAPGYIRLDTQYFNTTNCNNTSYHNTSYDTVCFKDTYNCCQNILSEISYLPDRRLGVCYTEKINNNTISFLYHCGNTELDKEQGVIFILSLIGIFFLFFTPMSCLIYISWCFFCNKSHSSGYGVIN